MHTVTNIYDLVKGSVQKYLQNLNNYSSSDIWKGRKSVSNYWTYKDELKLVAKLKNYILGDRVEMEFIIAFPKSWSLTKRREMWGKPHQQRPDIDNLAKGILDALKENDETVYEIKANKVWGNIGMVTIANRVD